MTDETSEYTGPRIGDHVRVEVSGRVVEMAARGGVAGALVDLFPTLLDAEPVWFTLEQLTLIGRRGTERPA